MPDARNRWNDRGLALVCWLVALTVSGVFLWILSDLLIQGTPRIDWQFLSAVPKDAGRSGGIFSILISTLLILSVCLAAALPIGVGAAALLGEFTLEDRGFAFWVRRSLDVLAGVPSIVFGLFGNAFFSQMLGMGFSILSGGLTLACMVLPILIRSAEESFRSVPAEYRQSAAALGLSRCSTFFNLMLPAALPGVVVGLVLGIGRALAETAALIFTSGYVSRLPDSVFDSGRALAVHIYDLAMNVPGGEQNAYASALVLVALLLLINGLAVGLADSWAKRRIMR